jgi:hypothetical protein
MINYAIGNPERNADFLIDMDDSYLGENAIIRVKSEDKPVHEDLSFKKIASNIYEAQWTPKSSGFYNFLGASTAVNNEKEYQKIGINDELKELVQFTGGKMFRFAEADELALFVQERSIRVKKDMFYLRWPLIIIIMIIYLIEIAIRKLYFDRNAYKSKK